MIEDTNALMMLNKIHSSVSLDYLFLNEEERDIFKTVQEYCERKEIKVREIRNKEELFASLIGEYPNSRVFAYLTNSETSEQLRDLTSKLERSNFHVETRTPSF